MVPTVLAVGIRRNVGAVSSFCLLTDFPSSRPNNFQVSFILVVKLNLAKKIEKKKNGHSDSKLLLLVEAIPHYKVLKTGALIMRSAKEKGKSRVNPFLTLQDPLQFTVRGHGQCCLYEERVLLS